MSSTNFSGIVSKSLIDSTDNLDVVEKKFDKKVGKFLNKCFELAKIQSKQAKSHAEMSFITLPNNEELLNLICSKAKESFDFNINFTKTFSVCPDFEKDDGISTLYFRTVCTNGCGKYSHKGEIDKPVLFIKNLKFEAVYDVSIHWSNDNKYLYQKV